MVLKAENDYATRVRFAKKQNKLSSHHILEWNLVAMIVVHGILKVCSWLFVQKTGSLCNVVRDSIRLGLAFVCGHISSAQDD